MGKRIVITSGKGGVGKTTVTAGVGSMLAEAGKRVVLVDADIGLNNLDVVLGIENKIVYDILDVVRCKCRLKQALVRDSLCPSLFILPSAKISAENEITSGAFKNIIGSLACSFDYVLVDCPAGIEEGFHRAVSAADEAIVVTTPSVTAIRDADKVLNLLPSYDLSEIFIVVNRIRGDLVARGEMVSASDISRLLRTPPIGVIPEDDNITLYSGLGRVPYDTPSGKAYKMLAASIISGQTSLYECNYKKRRLFNKNKRRSWV